MHERLYPQFLRRIGADGADIFYRGLAREDDSVRAESIKRVRRCAVDNAELGADMAADTRGVALGIFQYAEIGDYQRVYPRLLQKRKVAAQIVQLILAREGVAGDIHPHSLSCARRTASTSSSSEKLTVDARIPKRRPARYTASAP